jgi:hypothetical protein
LLCYCCFNQCANNCYICDEIHQRCLYAHQADTCSPRKSSNGIKARCGMGETKKRNARQFKALTCINTDPMLEGFTHFVRLYLARKRIVKVGWGGSLCLPSCAQNSQGQATALFECHNTSACWCLPALSWASELECYIVRLHSFPGFSPPITQQIDPKVSRGNAIGDGSLMPAEMCIA